MSGRKTTKKRLSRVVMAIGHESDKSTALPTRVRSAWLRFGQYGRCYYNIMDAFIRFLKRKKYVNVVLGSAHFH